MVTNVGGVHANGDVPDVPLNGVTLSRMDCCIFKRVPDRVTRMRSQTVGILGVRKFWLVGFKNGKIPGKKKVVTERNVALLI